MDDIVIRSKKEANLLFDLRRSGLRLNPEKCTFGVCSGKLLGYLVSQRGIKANPEKIRVIQKMPPPSTMHDAQRLNGCLAALSHFIAKLAERSPRSSRCSKGRIPSGGGKPNNKPSTTSRLTCSIPLHWHLPSPGHHSSSTSPAKAEP